MNRSTGIVTAAVLLAGVLAAPSPAVESRFWTTGWSLGAGESTQSHPKRLELFMPVTEDRRIDNCQLSYEHQRVAGEAAAPEMGSGGKISVGFEFVKGGETLKVGTGSAGVHVPEYSAYRRQAAMYFTDPSGYPEPGPVMRTPHLPIDLEAGDMIIWKVKFKGAKTLEFSDLGDGFWDQVDLMAYCSPCGSNAEPCD